MISKDIAIKIISLGFFLHFLQWLWLGISINTLGTIVLFLLIAGLPSLTASFLLWKRPKIGIPFAIIRSIIGIYFAIYYGQFLTLNHTYHGAEIIKGIPPIISTWPSVFFLISIILLVLLAITEKVYRNN